MEKIEKKIAKVQQFLSKNLIRYHYIDYKLVRGDCTKIQVITNYLSGSDIIKLENEYTLIWVNPFTNKHLNIEIDIDFI